MYDKKIRGWVSPPQEETVLNWCRESFNQDNPDATFLLADHMLCEGKAGKQSAEAVYLMESAAKLGHAQAMCAMGQMFAYGWAVHRDEKMAMEWFRLAAEAGSEQAAQEIAAVKRRKRNRLLSAIGAALLCVAAVLVFVCMPWLFTGEPRPLTILVHEDTSLTKTTTIEDFSKEVQGLVADYDDELVVSGQRSTNRLILRFEGGRLDLSGFLADHVIARENNLIVIQFADEAEAQRCLDELSKLTGIVFVEMDEYTIESHSEVPAAEQTEAIASYYTWGAEAMQMDLFAEYLAPLHEDDAVVVAVVDTGVEPHPETADRILEGLDVVTGGNGWVDYDGHGSHVGGTILDCTQGLNVFVLPIGVFGQNEGTSTLAVVTGIEIATACEVDVISMSIGGPHSESKDEAVANAVANDIMFVCSAGNGDQYGNPEDTANKCPAHMTEAVVVGACDIYGQAGSFSNYGTSVDVIAPGVEIFSYYNGGQMATLDGTSMATPHVSALCAMLRLHYPDKTAAQIERYVKMYCEELGNELYYGAGIPQAGYFIEN